MALPTTLTPGFVGIYGDWSRTGPTVGPGAAYANWLGDTVKENAFLGWCQSYGVTSIRIYNLNLLDSGSNFTAAAILMLRNFISKAKDSYGITEVWAVRNFFGCDDGLQGMSEINCVTNYNAIVNANERFEGANIEQEPWNFVGNPTSPAGTLSAAGTTVTGVGCAFTVNTAQNHFIQVAGQFRQVRSVTNNNQLIIDRAFSPAIPAGSTWQNYNAVTNGTPRYNFTVDYATYIYRADLARDILVAAGLEIELYISRNSTNAFLQQLALVCPATDGRIGITQFQANPNFNYDRNAVQQICSAGINVRIAFICSVESTTFYAGCDDPADCTASPDTNSNFLGFWFEGRNTIGVPTYAAKSWQDLWDYLTKPAPYTNTPTPSNLGTGANPSANEETNLLVQTHATFEGLIIFKQGIIRQLVIEPPDPLGASIIVHDNVSCNGLDDGALEVLETGGTGPFTYAWTGPGGFTATTAAIGPLAPGLYTVIVTDTSDASTVTIPNILVTEPSTITISGNIVPVVCNGGSTGAINAVTPSGGSGTYSTYAWTGPGGFVSALQNISGLIAGTYSLTVTDDAGCTGSTNFVVPEPTAISFTLTPTHPTCFNNNNGSILMTALVGGSGVGYTFAWSGPGGFTSTLQNPTGLNTPGVYTCIVTDSNLCTGTNNTTIITPTDITKSEVITPPSVFGASDAAINLTPAGGPSGVWTYQWSGPGGFTATTQDITGRVAGTYQVIITDGVCSRTFSIVIPEGSTPLVVIEDSYVDPICPGVNNGAINIHGFNGVAPYTYAWTGPGGFVATTQNIGPGLAPGLYSLVLTDSNGVPETANYSRTLLQNAAFDDSTAVVNDVTTYGANDGSIQPNITGGSGTYTSFMWTGPGGFVAITEDISGLAPGMYSLTVTDDEGCEDTFEYEILEGPPVALADDPIITDVICFGGSTGGVNPQITGGSGNYSYDWTGPNAFTSSDPIITGVPAGTYHLEVTDLDTLQTFSADYDVVESTEIEIEAIPTYGTPCGPGSASLNIGVTGGPAGSLTVELYAQPGGLLGTGLSYSGLLPGHYTAIAKIFYSGRLFCSNTLEFDIYACMGLTVGTEDVACFGGQVGIAQIIHTSGGSGSYTYLWDDPLASTTRSIMNQFAGTYTCTVTDTVTGEVVIVTAVIDQPYVQLTAGVAGGNPSTYNGTDGWAQALPVGGFGIYTYEWNDALAQTTQIATNLPAGTYQCIVTDSGKCSVTVEVTIVGPPSDELIPIDDTTKWLEGFSVRYDNLKCCYGEVTKKLATALQIGDKCVPCLTMKSEILRLIIKALGRWSYERAVTAAVGAEAGDFDMADNPAISVPTFAEWTLQVEGSTIASFDAYSVTLYANILAQLQAAVTTQGEFTYSNILPDIGFRLADAIGRGTFLNGKTATLSQRYTSIVIDPVYTQNPGDPDGASHSIAYDPTRKLTYVSDHINDQVYVYDINDVRVATIPVGDLAGASVYHPANDCIYVFCPGDQTCHKIRNLAVIGTFAISAAMSDPGTAVYDPSTQKIVVAETFSAGAPLNIYVYTSADVETVIPTPTSFAHVIFYNPNLFRVICLPRNAAQPRQLNTATNLLSAFSLTYPLGTSNIYGCVYVQDGFVDGMFIETQQGLCRYQFGGGFVSLTVGFNALALVYNAAANLIIGWSNGVIQAYNVVTDKIIIPQFPQYFTPGLTLAYRGISREVNGGVNTVVFCSTYFGGSGTRIGYVLEIQEIASELENDFTGGVDSFNTFTFNTCLDTIAQVEQMLAIADQICCDGCMGCG